MVGREVVSNNERVFLLEALRKKLRVDGRGIYDLRTVKISLGHHGYAEVQLGETRVIAIVTCEMVEPYPDHPTEGFFHFTVEFSPMADPSWEARRYFI